MSARTPITLVATTARHADDRLAELARTSRDCTGALAEGAIGHRGHQREDGRYLRPPRISAEDQPVDWSKTGQRKSELPDHGAFPPSLSHFATGTPGRRDGAPSA